MPGYLDQYGAGDEQRESLVKRAIVTVALVIVIGGLGYYLFKNHSQEKIGKQFISLVRSQSYPAAYQLWGCSQAKPCSGYEYDKFLEDWGPKASGADPAVLGIEDSESCGTGVILTMAVNRSRQEKLWIEKSNPVLSFSPVPACPGKSPFSIMIHRTVGKLRKPFLK